MADGRKKNGGARTGAGRKTKAEILGLSELIDEAWPIADQKKVLQTLAKDAVSTDFATRHTSRQLLLAYKFGKPKESRDLNIDVRTLTDEQLEALIAGSG
jgi:hypothetical protein